ncbi:MAG: zinc-ribbon domain-containing protein [Paracoccaceae bacterium]
MRLICPNCEAEYEVDDTAIPDMGRDVQCSNCGHAWFQLPPEIELALEQEDELFGAEGAADPVDPPAEPGPASAEPMPEPPRRSVDENLLAILREEAEREAAARKAEAAPIETQPDLGLPPASAAPASAAPSAASAAAPAVAATAATASGLGAAARRIAQLKGIDPDAPPPKPATRRDLLPDIEEINSSLKGGSLPEDAGSPDDAAAADNASGFRRGFALAMVIAVIGLALYVSAPRIVAMVPALDGPVQGYVGAVDSARLWLDATMRAATDTLRGMSGQEASGG